MTPADMNDLIDRAARIALMNYDSDESYDARLALDDAIFGRMTLDEVQTLRRHCAAHAHTIGASLIYSMVADA